MSTTPRKKELNKTYSLLGCSVSRMLRPTSARKGDDDTTPGRSPFSHYCFSPPSAPIFFIYTSCTSSHGKSWLYSQNILHYVCLVFDRGRKYVTLNTLPLQRSIPCMWLSPGKTYGSQHNCVHCYPKNNFFCLVHVGNATSLQFWSQRGSHSVLKEKQHFGWVIPLHWLAHSKNGL